MGLLVPPRGAASSHAQAVPDCGRARGPYFAGGAARLGHETWVQSPGLPSGCGCAGLCGASCAQRS
eukprot:2441993-Heterocapsa_arctica.AAC.1